MAQDLKPTRPAPELFASLSYHYTDPHTILQLAQRVLGMSTTFYAGLTDEAMDVQDVHHDQAAEERCRLASGQQAPLLDTYCQFVYRQGLPLRVPDAQHIEPFATLPTTSDINIGSYVGVPLLRMDGSIYGTLCGIDPATANVNDEQLALLQMLGHALMSGLERVQTLQELEQQRLAAQQAWQDALTGLPNRRALDHTVEAAVRGASLASETVSLIFVDIDHFKRINDAYGHAVGDGVLRLVAARLSRTLRENDQIFRYGGEELVVILPGADCEQSQIIAERMRLALLAPCQVGERDLHGAVMQLKPEVLVTASFGIATYPTHIASAPDLLLRADAAMYAAKRLGRNQVHCSESHDVDAWPCFAEIDRERFVA